MREFIFAWKIVDLFPEHNIRNDSKRDEFIKRLDNWYSDKEKDNVWLAHISGLQWVECLVEVEYKYGQTD